MEVVPALIAALAASVGMLFFMKLFFNAQRRLLNVKILLLDNEAIMNRYPDPDDDRYAPSVRDMARDMREIQEIVDGC